MNCKGFYKYKVFFHAEQKLSVALKRMIGVATNDIDDENSETWIPVLMSKGHTIENIRHRSVKESLVVLAWG